MKMKTKFYMILSALILWSTSCQIDEQIDPNSPDLNGGILTNANIAQLNNLVYGSVAGMRFEQNTYLDGVGVIGREIYRISGSEPRWVSDLLVGPVDDRLDNNSFYTGRNYGARYAVVKNTNILIEATTNSKSLLATTEKKNGYFGFAKTIQAHELLLVLNQQFLNGIRTDVADPDNLGPFVTYAEGLTFIANLLDEAADDLDAAGTSFTFKLATKAEDGWFGFTTPQTFRQFNRALAARVAVYRGNYADALTFLDESFFDIAGDLHKGIYHIFSPSPGDLLNPAFVRPNRGGEIRAVHPSFLTDAEAGDSRLSVAVLRTTPASTQGLSSTHDALIFTSNTSRMPVITNTELVLIFAEASIQVDGNNSPDGVAAINVIRDASNLNDYPGATDKTSLLNEMLKQRRYSLYMQGHRWVDMRRYNKLNELPVDRAGDVIHTQFPRPFQEIGVNGG